MQAVKDDTRCLGWFPSVSKAIDFGGQYNFALIAALRLLQEQVQRLKLTHNQVAIVMDLDDTILFSRTQGEGKELHPDEEGDPEDHFIHPEGPEGLPKLRKRMKQFFEDLKKIGKVFFVTARNSDRYVGNYTAMELLDKNGIGGWEECLFCPRAQRANWHTISTFKRNARRRIERKHGCKILMTVGDKMSDHLCDPHGTNLLYEYNKLRCGTLNYVLARNDDEKQRTVYIMLLCSRKRPASRGRSSR